MKFNKQAALLVANGVWIGFLVLSGWLLTLYSSVFFWSDNSQMSQSLVQSLTFPFYPALALIICSLYFFLRRLATGSYRFRDPCILGFLSILIGIWIQHVRFLSPNTACISIVVLLGISTWYSVRQAWRELRACRKGVKP
jgi:hypothetical protein